MLSRVSPKLSTRPAPLGRTGSRKGRPTACPKYLRHLVLAKTVE